MIRKVNAARFANHDGRGPGEGSIADAVWYANPLEVREGKPSEVLYKEVLDATRGPTETNPKLQGLLALKKRLTSTPGQEIHFVKIEDMRRP